MADILIDEKEDYKNGIGLLASYINKAPVRDENLESIMRLADKYLAKFWLFTFFCKLYIFLTIKPLTIGC